MIKTQTCVIICCDSCGSEFDNGEYTPHFRDPEDAYNQVDEYEWAVIRFADRVAVFCTGLPCWPPCECDDCGHDACPQTYEGCLKCPRHNIDAATAHAEAEKARRAAAPSVSAPDSGTPDTSKES